MRRVIFLINLVTLTYGLSPAQTTYNLEIIFQRGTPDTSVSSWGAAIAGLGDVNGDGYDDAGIVGYSSTLGARVYLFGGSPAFDTIPEWITGDATAGPGTGLALCGGDINGDGCSDVILEAAGKVYVYYGKVGWPNTAYDLRFLGRLYEGATSLATGDLNGDDTTDLIVGDFWNMSGNGHVNIYLGSAVFDTIPWLVIRGKDLEQFGSSLDAGGDVNGDGIQDLLVGAATNNVDSRGRIYLFHGGPAMDTIPDWWKDGEGSQQYWGEFAGSIANDTNGNGRLWFGSYYYPGGYLSTLHNGKGILFYGGLGMDTIADMTVVGADTFSGLGSMFASSKIDSGLRSDLICGSSEIGWGKGLAWTSKLIQDTVVSGWMKGRWYGDKLGVKVVNAGDVNNDGREEVMFGSNADTNRLVVICKYTGPEGVTGEPEFKIQNSEFKIYQNAPNPFSHQTTIKYQIAKSGQVNLSVYNITGQLVKTLINDNSVPLRIGEGREGSITWNGRDNNNNAVSNGVYIYRLRINDKSKIKKMTLIR